MSEAILQRAVARVLDHSGLLWCHVPNGGQRNVIVAAKLKGEGVKPGVPDVLVFAPITTEPSGMLIHNGLAIELKNGKKGRTSQHQKMWMGQLERHGWRVAVCHNLDEALAVLRECYPNKFPQ